MQFFVIYSYFTEEERSRDHYRELTEEQNPEFDEDHLKIIQTLNAEQIAGYEEILDHVLKNKGQVFFVDGPGGTGKTYLYKALIAKVRSMDFIAVATATYGIIEIFSHKFLIGPFASVIGGSPNLNFWGQPHLNFWGL